MVQTIRTFVVDNYLFGEEGKLNDDDSFMETGIIDSTGILELVRFRVDLRDKGEGRRADP